MVKATARRLWKRGVVRWLTPVAALFCAYPKVGSVFWEYEIYLSNDGQEWGEPAAKGRIPREASDEIIQLRKPAQARYVKFVALNEQNGQPFASVAELEVFVATP